MGGSIDAMWGSIEAMGRGIIEATWGGGAGSAPCWDLLMMRLTIGLSVLSTALLCALITTAVLLVGLTALDFG